MAKSKSKKLRVFHIFNKQTDVIKEHVYSKYAAKQRTLFHNNVAYENMEGTPYKWREAGLQ